VAHSDPKAITDLGLDAKLRKPVTNRQLKNVLSRILGSRRVESDQLEKKGAPPESTDLSSEPGLSDLKVLLVEDNPINRRVTSLQLERLGVSADVVCSGAEALEILTKNEFHLILMDCQMPELDGFETTRELRRRWPDRKVGVIALTAHAMEGDRERCIEAGMDDYLGKPLAVEKLKEVLGSWHERLLSV
jgi:CheY-like chemotaxis protein